MNLINRTNPKLILTTRRQASLPRDRAKLQKEYSWGYIDGQIEEQNSRTGYSCHRVALAEGERFKCAEGLLWEPDSAFAAGYSQGWSDTENGVLLETAVTRFQRWWDGRQDSEGTDGDLEILEQKGQLR